jgi:hypothetical protein
MKHSMIVAALVALAPLGGCKNLPLNGLGGLGNLAGQAPVPDIKVSAVALDAKPSNSMLAAFYCAKAASGSMFGIGCRVFGNVPSINDLKFTFHVELQAHNPSSIPMPVVSALVAFTAYPQDTGGQNLGSVCVEMCEDPNNCPQSANACDSSDPQIRGTRDFAQAAAGFLVSTALNGGPKTELRMPLVQPGTSLKFAATLTLNIDQMLALIKRASSDALSQITSGRQPTFVIPWAVEGSVWVRFEGFGRIGAGFPRSEGNWAL